MRSYVISGAMKSNVLLLVCTMTKSPKVKIMEPDHMQQTKLRKLRRSMGQSLLYQPAHPEIRVLPTIT